MTDRANERPSDAGDDPREQQFTQWLAELRAAVAESVNGSVLRGARAVQVGWRAGSTRRPATSAGALVGFCLAPGPQAGGANVIFIHDGADQNAPLLLSVRLDGAATPGGSVLQWFGPGGIHYGDSGLFIIDDTGEMFEGCVYLRGAE